MTSNDKQIDVLIRRYAQNASRVTGGEHLDADETSAFAEGLLPAAARARYVSHLADCDQCRQLVSQLAITGGATIQAEPLAEAGRRTLWQALTGLLAVPGLRYAAFAAMLLIVAGVAYVVLRRPSTRSDLVAVNEPATQQQPVSALKPGESAGKGNTATTAERPAQAPQPTAGSEQTFRRDGGKLDEKAEPTPAPLKDAPAITEFEKKAAQPETTTVSPSYAPPPPSESQAAPRAAPGVGGLGSISGPRKGESADKLAGVERERDAAKETSTVEENRIALNKPAAPVRRSADQKQKGPSRNLENTQASQNASEGRAEAPKTQAGNDRAATEETSPTRSIGGHKFQKQSNAWVDQKFKASMTLKNIARGSDEFNGLDSGLRSIAQQLSGQVIVVWKGKAYLIR